MTQVTLEVAGTQLPKLIEAANRGEEVIIAQNSQPGVKLVPIPHAWIRREPGSAKHLLIYMAEDFDAPLEDFKEYME